MRGVEERHHAKGKRPITAGHTLSGFHLYEVSGRRDEGARIRQQGNEASLQVNTSVKPIGKF